MLALLALLAFGAWVALLVLLLWVAFAVLVAFVALLGFSCSVHLLGAPLVFPGWVSSPPPPPPLSLDTFRSKVSYCFLHVFVSLGAMYASMSCVSSSCKHWPPFRNSQTPRAIFFF